MKIQLKKFIEENVKNPKPEEVEEILQLFEERKLKKGAFFKKPFTRNKEFGFLVKGAMRLVIYKEGGEEVTARLVQENAFIADVISIQTNQLTPFGFECLSEVAMLVAPLEKIQQILETNLAFNVVMRKHVVEKATELGQKYLLFLTGNAKERYQFILENNPKLLEKFPLRLIASLIGITPTQLSRIRNKKVV